MSTPPISSKDNPVEKSLQLQNDVDGAKKIDTAIEQTAAKALPPKTVPTDQGTGEGWWVWNWNWPWGQGTQEKPKVQEEDKKGGSPITVEFEDEDISSKKKDDLTSDEKEEKSSDLLEEATATAVDVDIDIKDKEVSTKSVEKKEPVEETLIKTYQAAQETKWERAKGGLGNLAAWAVSPGVRLYAYSYKGSVDKEGSIAKAKQEMLSQLHDPQFVEFYEVAKTVISPIIKDLLDSFEVKADVITTQYILPNRELIIDLLEINLARGFANLARQVKQNETHIPNYDKQPTLVSILSLFSQKAGSHINAKLLSDLEGQYKDDRKALHDQTQALFPGIDQQPKLEEAVQKYIKEYVKSTDANRKNDIKRALFPKIDSAQDQKAKDIKAFLVTLDILHQRDQEFHKLFSLISDDILLYLFPNKFADMEAPGLLQYESIQDWIYNAFMRDQLANFLQESFDSLENDSVRNKAWEDELQTKVGAPDLKTIIQAPSSLLVAFAKNYIQADPEAMRLVAQSIDSMIHPAPVDIVKKRLNALKTLIKDDVKDKELIESLEREVNKVGAKDQNIDNLLLSLQRQKRALSDLKIALPSQIDKLKAELKDLIKAVRESKNPASKPQEKTFLNQLSQEQLANWIIESAQAMLNTEDPNLAGLGQFIKQGVNNLALALMAKGAALVIPENEQIESHAFAKEFSDRLIEKFSSLKKEDITDQFWKNFVKDLPLPDFVKELLVPHLTDQAKNLQAGLQSPDLQKIQKMHAEAEQAILKYEGGKQLLSITEKVSDQIIELVLEKNIGLITTFGLGDTIEELFAQYLPGVVINDDLKNWFKENVSALGITEEGESPQSIVLLKQGIQAVLRRAMVDTIEKNFKNDSKDYAAQLLKNFHQAFEKAFAGFNTDRRKKIDQALDIQADIEEANDEIAEIKQNIAKSLLKPLVEGLVPEAEEDDLSHSLAALIDKPNQTEVSEKDVLTLLKAKVETKSKDDEQNLEKQAHVLTKSVNQVMLNRKPLGLEKNQTALIEDCLNANIRYTRASNYVESLIEKRNELLAKLNEGYDHAPWTTELLPLVSEALVLRSIEAPGYANLKDFEAALSIKIKGYISLIKDNNLPEAEKKNFAKYRLLQALLNMSSEELEQFSGIIHTHTTLQHAEKERAHLSGELKVKKDAIEHLEENKIKDAKAWNDAKEWMGQVLEGREKINKLSKEIVDLQEELDEQLGDFQALSEELTGLLGLSQKERLDLPPYLQDSVWPYIESAKKSHIARLLFAQISPLLISIHDIQKNKDKLNQLAKGDALLGQLIYAGAEEAINLIPELVKSYKPFAKQILVIMGVDQPTEEEVGRMEEVLDQTLIELGKKGTVASMLKPLVKDFVPEKDEDDLSQALASLTSKVDQIEVSKQDVLDLLKTKVQTTNKKEEQKLEQQAQILTKSVNQFLLNRGKTNLKPNHLLAAYQGQIEGKQVAIPADQEKGVLDNLKSERIVEKIKAVIITPEEIVQALNDVIPGATDLHALIAPQLQAVIVGDDATFKENREVLQRFLEGTILRLFVKIAEANEGKDVLVVITQKLKNLAQNSKLVAGKKTEEIAREMIDQVLEEVLGIAALEDLDSIPPAFRKIAYDKVKEQAYQQLTPLILPIIEREQSRTELKNLSGSNFLGNLCQALSKDVFELLPSGFKSYQSIAENVFELLSDRAPNEEEIDDFAKEIVALIKEKNVKNSSLVEVYAKVANLTLTSADQERLKTKLEERKAKDEIKDIVVTPQEIATAVLPLNVKNYRSIAEELLMLLSESQPTNVQIDKFTHEIANLIKKNGINHSSIVHAYAKVTDQILGVKDQENLKAKLKARQAEDEIKKLSKEYRQLHQAFANKLQGLITDSPETYQNVSEFAGTYIEGVLLKIFIGVANKNPKQPGKDTLIILTEKLLDVATKKYQAMKNGDKVEDVVQDLNDAIMKDILGIDSPDAFKGLPDALKATAYDAIKDELGDLFLKMHTSLSTVESSNAQVQAAKDKVKQKEFGIAEGASKGYVQILAEDIANMVMTAVPDVLSEITGEKMKGVVIVSKEIESYLEDLARGNLKMAKVLLKYSRGDQFQKMLGDHLATLTDKDNLVDDKQKAANLLSNLLLVPMSQVIEKAINFENEQGAKFNQQLMLNFLTIGVGHLKNFNAAKELAAQSGRTAISHQDFVQVAGGKLHPAVPKEPVSYQKSIEFITKNLYGRLTPEEAEKWTKEQDNVRQLMAKMVKAEVVEKEKVITLDDFIKEFDDIHLRVHGKRLTKARKIALKHLDDKGFTLRDLIRQEAEAPIIQRQKEAYGPMAKGMMKMIFPNGKNDLTFVPEELRGAVWKAFKKNLFPAVLPIMTEVILDPAMINSIVLSSLEVVRDTLSEEIVLDDVSTPPVDYTTGELNKVAGELIFEVLKITKLPSRLKNLILDSEQKGISERIKKNLGDALLKQFNDTFIQDKLKIALEKAVERINPETGEVHADGKSKLTFEVLPKEIKEQEEAKKAKKTQEALKKISREIVDGSIAYGIRSMWISAQNRFDKLVEAAFGKVGRKVKHALDAVFRFIFFKIIGTVPSILLRPVKQLVKEKIYSMISMDKNRDAILEMFTQLPDDQPLTGISTSNYPVYNEDLIFKLSEALNQTVQDFLKKEPVLPLSKGA